MMIGKRSITIFAGLLLFFVFSPQLLNKSMEHFTNLLAMLIFLFFIILILVYVLPKQALFSKFFVASYKENPSSLCWYTSVVPVLQKLRWEDHLNSRVRDQPEQYSETLSPRETKKKKQFH
jgi:uncharacterized protein with PQ loop repeat